MTEKFNSRFPYYNDDRDYTTNAPSYYDDLARKNKLLKILSERIYEYDKTLDNSLANIKNVLDNYIDKIDHKIGEGFNQEINDLLVQWVNDGTLEHIINTEIFNKKVDITDFNKVIRLLKINDSSTTEEIQAQLDTIVDGEIIRIPKGLYNVVKNTSLEGFPNNDQPCLLLRDLKDVKILAHGTKFKTNAHAQGVLEIQLCENVIVEGIETIGYGSFPSLFGSTGRGEKGTSTGGYYTSGFWGFYKNNSYDTTDRISDGRPWGMFGNGFIGNIAHGLLIHNGCKNVTLRECKSEGFNYSGFSVGHIGNYFPQELDYLKNENILFERCFSRKNYSSNYYVTDVTGFTMDSLCVSEDAGHPDAKISDTASDPGYGVTVTGTSKTNPDDIYILNSIFNRTVRKAIDVHAGSNITIKDNKIDTAFVGGIYGAWSSIGQFTRNMTIDNNYVKNAGISPLGSQGGFYYQGRIDGDYSKQNVVADVKLINNTFEKCGGQRVIFVRTFNRALIKNNTVLGFSKDYGTGIGIMCGKAGDRSYNLIMKDNFIHDEEGLLKIGIQVLNVESGTVQENNIELLGDVSNKLGLYSSHANGKVNFIGNIAIVSEIGKPFSFAATEGIVSNNTGIGGNEESYNPSGVGTLFMTLGEGQTLTPDVETLVNIESEFNDGIIFNPENGGFTVRKDCTVVVSVQCGFSMPDSAPYEVSDRIRLNGGNLYGYPLSTRSIISTGLQTINTTLPILKLKKGDKITYHVTHKSLANRVLQSNGRITWLSAHTIR